MAPFNVRDLLIERDFLFRPSTIKILVVIDGSVLVTQGGFSVHRFVRLLRETQVGCTKFEVDIAHRGTPFGTSGADPKYQNFTFDQTESGSRVIDKYHQLWLLGIRSESDAIGNAEILAVNDFMAAGGGVFANGDHNNLGAAMGAFVPRVRKMRRWTESDNAPDSSHPPSGTWGTWINTHWATSGNVIPSGAETDATPQPIDWVTWRTATGPFLFTRQKRPHPILCPPQRGPIDVMPDHTHEGRVQNLVEIDLTSDLVVNGSNLGAEFPLAGGGTQPKPFVIANGRTLSEPPNDHVGYNSVPGVQFPMISVYDGRAAGVGRIVTDSTWHHWFDLNIEPLESGNTPAWEKVSRYFLNIATWLSPSVFRQHCLLDIIVAPYEFPGVETINPRFDSERLGLGLAEHLRHSRGPCWVTELIYTSICDWIPEACEVIIPDDRPPGGFPPDPCWSCPPWERFENIALGGLARIALEFQEEIQSTVKTGKASSQLKLDEVEARFAKGLRASFEEAAKDVVTSAKQTADKWSSNTKSKR